MPHMFLAFLWLMQWKAIHSNPLSPGLPLLTLTSLLLILLSRFSVLKSPTLPRTLMSLLTTVSFLKHALLIILILYFDESKYIRHVYLRQVAGDGREIFNADLNINVKDKYAG